ncbi:TPA: hypothetical protein L6A15_15605 [Pseudomonas aeruginosa]|nr:hypothetical protein [Pseudomonas aeruginosa]
MSNNEEKPSLKDLVNKISSGVGNLARKKPGQDSASQSTEPTIDLGSAAAKESPQADAHGDELEPLEPIIAEDDDQKPKKTNKLSQLTMGQKLIAAILVVGLVLFAKGQMEGSSTSQTPSENEAAQEAPTSSEEGMAFGTEPADHPQAEPGAQDDLSLPIDGPGQTSSSLSSEPEPFQKPTEISSAPPAFGGLDQPLSEAAPHTTASPDLGVPAPAPAPAPALAPAAEPFSPHEDSPANPFGAQAPIASQSGAAITSSIGAEKQPPVFAGTPSVNPDSAPVKEAPKSNEALTKANADIAAQAEKISALEQKLSKMEAQLKAEKAKQTKPAVQQRITKAPTRTPVAKSSPVAISKARPRICVKAVAEAARNCSTCVAHAFIVHAGAEDMVGQGDFLDGYRVSIVGDRLDLQDKNGQVAHKFWSSPNGCSAI